MAEQQPRWVYYAALISAQIQEMFEEDAENHIDPSKLSDPAEFKNFIHAFATVAPCHFFNKVAEEQQGSHLEFNHVANSLCFEYCEKDQQ